MKLGYSQSSFPIEKTLNSMFLFVLSGILGALPLSLAVNIEPSAVGIVQSISCPSDSTLRLTLESTSAQVYINYIASHDTWPVDLFYGNFDKTSNSTEDACSGYGTLAAFSVGAPGSLQSDGTTYIITNFQIRAAHDAIVDAHQVTRAALKPDSRSLLTNWQDADNCADGVDCNTQFKNSLQVPPGYTDLVSALGNLTKAPQVANKEGKSFHNTRSKRDLTGSVISLGKNSALDDTAVEIGVDTTINAIPITVARTLTTATKLGELGEEGTTITELWGAAGGPSDPVADVAVCIVAIVLVAQFLFTMFGTPDPTPGFKFETLPNPSVYKTPWLVIVQKPLVATGSDDPKDGCNHSNDGNDDATITVTTSEALSTTQKITSTILTTSATSILSSSSSELSSSSSSSSSSSVACPGATGQPSSANQIPSEFTIPKSGPCEVYLKSVEFKAPEVSWSIPMTGGLDAEVGETDMEGTLIIICKPKGTNLAKSWDKDLKEVNWNIEVPGAPQGTCNTAYINLSIEGAYNLLGSGELDVGFKIHLDKVKPSLSGLDNSGGQHILETNSPSKSESTFEITKFVPSLSIGTTSFGLNLAVGMKEYVDFVETLDVEFMIKPEFRFKEDTAKISIDLDSSEKVKPKRELPLRRWTPRNEAVEDSTAKSENSTESNNDAKVSVCNQVVAVKGGVETEFTVTAAGKKIFDQPIEQLSWWPLDKDLNTTCTSGH